jgi:diguanylate cyclase (GGDEF)-like protein
MSIKTENKSKGLSITALISFFAALILSSFLITATIINKTNIEKLKIEFKIEEKANLIGETISRLFYKTQALSAIVIQGNGSINGFETVAPFLVNDPAIQNVLMAPNGIVSRVYPSAGNDNFLGQNFLYDEAGNRENITAAEMGNLILRGPFDEMSGRILTGKLPVYINTQTGSHRFWGLVSVIIKFPEVLEKINLDVFDTNGYAYELWRINPETSEKQIIAGSIDEINPNTDFMEKKLCILNAEWHLKVSPVRLWYSYPENIALVITGLCLSLIVLFVIQNNSVLKTMHSTLEYMTITDPLTGIYNRRHFMETAQVDIEKARRMKRDCYLTILNIDKFKNINNTYGHTTGDKVLIEITKRIKASIRNYDLLARFGGEEFILYTSDITGGMAYDTTERIRLSICGKKYEYDNFSFDVSASFGIAHIQDYDLKNAIKLAGEALHIAKKNGRNCVSFTSPENSQNLEI